MPICDLDRVLGGKILSACLAMVLIRGGMDRLSFAVWASAPDVFTLEALLKVEPGAIGFAQYL